MTIAEDWKKLEEHLNTLEKTKVRVALFGQPGAGKSSLINKIMGENRAVVSQRTDTTVERNVYEWNGLYLEDLPGFGTSRFKKETYFKDFEIEQDDLFLCVFSGKFHEADTEFFRKLKGMGKTCIFVRNKHDEIWEEDKEIEQLEEEIRNDVIKQVNNSDIIVTFTSCRKNHGLDKLIQLIENNLEPAKKERWISAASVHSVEFLNKKKTTCEKWISIAAGSSAASAAIPIPGVDFACDITILLGLFTTIRNTYGLTPEKLSHLSGTNTAAGLITLQPIISNIIASSTQTGILTLLKSFAGKQITKQVSKYIPFIGTAIAASTGFMITQSVGQSYLEDCHKVAEEIFNQEINKQQTKRR